MITQSATLSKAWKGKTKIEPKFQSWISANRSALRVQSTNLSSVLFGPESRS